MSNNILKIIFNASTIDGIIGKDIRYKPLMSNPTLYSSFPDILFIPTIKLSNKLFDKNLGEDDIKKIFLSPNQFDNFLTRLSENKSYIPLSINQAKKKGIIYNNIKFILNLFFPKDSELILNSNKFIINNYQWNDKYTLIPVPGKKTPIVEVRITFVLHKGEDLSFIDATRLNCMQSKKSIVNDYNKLVGLKPSTNKTSPLKYNITSNPKPKKKPKNKTVRTTTTTYNYNGGKKNKYKI
ncbi:hypothetical protein N8996_04460 [Candidatus Poseidonia alphae]|nr:hypothetical protein [Candidatus Poseidonia alphae]